MATTLILYHTSRSQYPSQEWELLPNRLLIVEDIESYLASKTKTTISNFQYQKNELELGINVDLGQVYSQPKTTTSFKYVSIQNDNELVHYYFVKKATWRSKTCVRFELVMDVLNTFKEKSDYIFKGNTRIIREHKDRFTYGDSNLLEILIGEAFSGEGTFEVGQNIDILDNNEETIFTGSINKLVLREGDNVLLGLVIDVSDSTLTHEEILTALEENENSPICFYVSDEIYMWIATAMGIINFVKTLYRKIDLVSEGINPILNHDSKYSITDDKNLLNKNWYLLYRNQNNPSESLVNPVECYLIPETSTPTHYAIIENGRLIPSFITDGRYYYFRLQDGRTATLSNGTTWTGTGSIGSRDVIMITKSQDKLVCTLFRTLADNEGYYIINTFDDISYITFGTMPMDYNYYDSFHTPDAYHDSYPYSFTNTSISNLDSINKLDRTDAKNIKLIKLPYCPYDFSISGGKIQESSDWEYVSMTQSGGGIINCLRLHNLNTKLEHTFKTTNHPFSNLNYGDISPLATDLRKPLSDRLESKLFHSDFWQPSYVYDSFVIKIDLEKCDMTQYIGYSRIGTYTNIKFNMTSTINSKFMFTFKDYKSDKAESNFYDILPIARNNEVVLYNVPYINYIRTGFNYDVKTKNLQNVSNYVGLGLSAASVGASLLLPSVPLKVAGVVASLVSMAMSVKNTVVSTINNENSLKQKQEQLQNQASSVAGSDDVDLMSEYCKNRMYYFIYRPTENMQNILNDLFFYAGYSSNRMGVPTHNNRINFDYLECEASLEAVATIPEECISELVNCFKAGVTYLHRNTDRVVYNWDFEQKYENWEKMLFN